MNNPWASLQSAVAQQLAGVPYFTDVPVVTEDAGDLESVIQRALTQGAAAQPGAPTRAGVAVLILTPTGEAATSSAGHVLCDTTLAVTVYERPAANRASLGIGKPALDVMWQVTAALTGWQPDLGARGGQFVGFDSFVDGESGVLAYQVRFRFRQSIEV